MESKTPRRYFAKKNINLAPNKKAQSTNQPVQYDQSSEDQTSRSIFIKNLPLDCERETLMEVFSQVGPVVHLNFRKAHRTATLEFSSSSAAQSCVGSSFEVKGEQVKALESKKRDNIPKRQRDDFMDLDVVDPIALNNAAEQERDNEAEQKAKLTKNSQSGRKQPQERSNKHAHVQVERSSSMASVQEKYQEHHKTSITDALGFEAYLPILGSTLVNTLIHDMKFSYMMPVQAQTIKPLTQGFDCHIQAKTGTGKTVSFLVPAIHKIMQSPKTSGIRLLVISPTRELATQIATEAELITKRIPEIKIGIAIGGTNISSERKAIMQGIQILIATPGRLLDHLENNRDISSLVYGLDTFVLDECDRLLDMGFSPDIFKIMGYLPKDNRQSILCSATLTPRVKDIAVKMLNSNYVFVSTLVKGEESTHQKVPQFFMVAPFVDQLVATISLLMAEAHPTFKAIVFLPTAQLANLYHAVYKPVAKNVLVQHARQSQSKRQNVSDTFKACQTGIMFATDVVARGMDYPGVTHVFQIGLPDSRETYIHRIGRTGRAEANGKGFLILAPEETGFTNQLKGIPLTNVPLTVHRDAAIIQKQGMVEFRRESDDNPMKVYQSWLGYYKGELKTLRYSAAQLVHTANVYACTVMDCMEPPALEARVVGKMGLKGTPDLVISKVSASKPSRGGRGGGRGGRR